MTSVNRLGALLLGLVLAGIGLLTVVETIAITVWDRDWPVPVLAWRDRLTTIQWADRRVLIVSIVVLVAGLLLLGAEFKRVRPRQLRTAIDSGDNVWEVRRRSVERQAANAVRGIRGVDHATAKATGKQDHWKLAVTASAAGRVVEADDVRRVVEHELVGLGAPDDTPLRVTVTGGGSRS